MPFINRTAIPRRKFKLQPLSKEFFKAFEEAKNEPLPKIIYNEETDSFTYPEQDSVPSIESQVRTGLDFSQCCGPEKNSLNEATPIPYRQRTPLHSTERCAVSRKKCHVQPLPKEFLEKTIEETKNEPLPKTVYNEKMGTFGFPEDNSDSVPSSQSKCSTRIELHQNILEKRTSNNSTPFPCGQRLSLHPLESNIYNQKECKKVLTYGKENEVYKPFGGPLSQKVCNNTEKRNDLSSNNTSKCFIDSGIDSGISALNSQLENLEITSLDCVDVHVTNGRSAFQTPIKTLPRTPISLNDENPTKSLYTTLVTIEECDEEITDSDRDKTNCTDIEKVPTTSNSPKQAKAQNLFNTLTIKNVEYIVIDKLGKGGSSYVHHCLHLETRKQKAIKVVRLDKSSFTEGYINEVKILTRLQHCDRIVKMFDYEITNEYLYVVLEMGGADFSKILKHFGTTDAHIPIHILTFYWMEMLLSVKEIHENGIIHTDLKPANFVRFEGVLKLIDFGISRCIDVDMTSILKTVPEGSFNYISPEALINEQHNENSIPNNNPKYKLSYKSDVWSLGCILYQLIYKCTPFHHVTNPWKKILCITDPNYKINYPPADWLPPKFITSIKQCLQYNMKSRPSVNDLIYDHNNIF